jgi:uncharacterized protein (TIGR03083 family)
MAAPSTEKIPARFEKLLERLKAARDEFKASYEGLTEEQMLEPGVTGDWSVRDLIAHVTWWDEEAIEHLPAVLHGHRAPKYSDLYGGIDAFNTRRTEERSEQSLAEVLDAFESTHERLIAYLRSTPVDEIVGQTRFRRRLRLDTYGHYPEHTEQIRTWRAEKGI